MRRSIFSLLLLLPLCGAGHAVPAADSLPLHPPAPAIAPATIAFSPAGRTEELPQLAGVVVHVVLVRRPPCRRTGSSGCRSTGAAIPAATDGGA